MRGQPSALARAGIKAHGEVRGTVLGYAAREIVEDAKWEGRSALAFGPTFQDDVL